MILGAKNALFCLKNISLAKEPDHTCPNSFTRTIFRFLFDHAGQMPRTAQRVVARARWNVLRPDELSRRQNFQLTGGFVVACGAAGLAIQEPIVAQPNVDHRLAKHAILLAHTVFFRLLALRALIFGGTGTCAHEMMLSFV